MKELAPMQDTDTTCQRCREVWYLDETTLVDTLRYCWDCLHCSWCSREFGPEDGNEARDAYMCDDCFANYCDECGDVFVDPDARCAHLVAASVLAGAE